MTAYFDKDDNTLVELTLLGENRAYEELVTRHERAVMGTAYKITGNTYSAEDASQDAFVSAWMNLSALRDTTKFSSWVCSIAKNCARSLRAHYLATVPDISLDAAGNIAFTEEGEDLSDLHDAVDALSEKIRETVKLHYFEGLSIKEIAAQLGVAEGTVKWRLSEGRKQLRRGFGMMEDTYHENETLAARVMRQVEHLQRWRLMNDMTGFEEEYREVLAAIDLLDESTEKSHMLASVLRYGYWWLTSEENEETLARIRTVAEAGHNDDVMGLIAAEDYEKYEGEERIAYMRDTQIPYYETNGYPQTTAHLWFWLGYEYYKKKDYTLALEAFESVLRYLPTDDVYYANAKAAIHVCNWCRNQKDTNDDYHHEDATGELLRYADGKLHFVMQPGFGSSKKEFASVLYMAGACDRLMYDDELAVGESIASSGNMVTLTCLSRDDTVDTPAGHFEHCVVMEWVGVYHSEIYAKTWFAPGVGIVRQLVNERNENEDYLLVAYQIEGGTEPIPFAVGNRWEYTSRAVYESCDEATGWRHVYEVEGCRGDHAAISAYAFSNKHEERYRNTWIGEMLTARHNYHDGNGNLTEVRPYLAHAAELAVTKRQKRHTAIASEVMERIFTSDIHFNPAYTHKGVWNFFEYDRVLRRAGNVKLSRNTDFSFEWKALSAYPEGNKVWYSFMHDLLLWCTGYVWSDSWKTGYTLPAREGIEEFTVYEGETIETPAGTFRECRHISLVADKYKKPWQHEIFDGRSDFWFAPGIGLVKFSHPLDGGRLENIWWLTAYEGVGEGYFPTDDGLWRRWEPKLLRDGFTAALEYTFDSDETGTVLFHNATGLRTRETYEEAVRRMQAQKKQNS